MVFTCTLFVVVFVSALFPGDLPMAFPVTRLRRLRRTAELRNLVCETRLTPDAFVYPMFVCPGEGVRKAVGSMPGVFNLSVDEAVKEAREVHALGVPSVILFGLPDKKDEVATGAGPDDGIVQQATRAIKREVAGTDRDGGCLFVRVHVARALRDREIDGNAAIAGSGGGGYDDAVAARAHGEGQEQRTRKIRRSRPRQIGWRRRCCRVSEIVNDASLELLARTSVSLAKAGIDIIAPSDMMDGRVGAIRAGAGRGRFHQHADSFVCGEVCIGILWTISRGGRLGAAIRRPAVVSDGWGEYSRGDAGD